MESFRFDPNPTGLGGQNYDNAHLPAPGDDGVRFAKNWPRIGAWFIDWILPYLLLTHDGDLIALLGWAAMIYNSVWWQGKTGASLGKRCFGLQLAYIPESLDRSHWSFMVPGVGRCAVRYVVHFIDCILLMGLFKALMNPYSRTFADVAASCVVVQDKRIRLESHEPA